MYNLSVGAVFKNESDSMKEWIDHYLFHGVDHFYLINDKSDDNFIEILQPYIDKNIVSLFNADWTYYLGRQRDMYNTFILPKLKESKWVLIEDLDEYMWSPERINLNTVLNGCSELGQIQVNHTLFGSNMHINQPESIVKHFNRRSVNCPCENEIGNRKYFINTSFEFTGLNIHHATFANSEDEMNKFIILGPEWFIMNHYCCQSREFWEKVKCTRGDSDHYIDRNERRSDFNKYDLNDVEDNRLYLQNSSMDVLS